MEPRMPTRTCSIILVSPMIVLCMNHQNHTWKNGYGSHVRYSIHIQITPTPTHWWMGPPLIPSFLFSSLPFSSLVIYILPTTGRGSPLPHHYRPMSSRRPPLSIPADDLQRTRSIWASNSPSSSASVISFPHSLPPRPSLAHHCPSSLLRSRRFTSAPPATNIISREDRHVWGGPHILVWELGPRVREGHDGERASLPKDTEARVEYRERGW
jgi:hypothetical protein